jgi:hypothetical protein
MNWKRTLSIHVEKLSQKGMIALLISGLGCLIPSSGFAQSEAPNGQFAASQPLAVHRALGIAPIPETLFASVRVAPASTEQTLVNTSSSSLHPYPEASISDTTDHPDDGALPDAPMPAGRLQEQAKQNSPSSGQHQNYYPLSTLPLSGEDKLHDYIHAAFGPPAVIMPAFMAGYRMMDPPKNYPRDWKDGAEAFGRNYGAELASRTANASARFIANEVFHEDPRYMPSTSTNGFARTFHALAFTVVDHSDSGNNMLAIGNFAGAAAGGFVGMGIRPDGFNDVTHAGQQATMQFAMIGAANVLTEFAPEWGPWAKKFHILNIIPSWWVPEHKH